MLVLLCGLPGSGKSTLAAELLRRAGGIHMDIDAVKRELYPCDPDYGENLRLGRHFSDATRLRVLHRVADDLLRADPASLLIADDVFGKRIFRDVLSAAARTRNMSVCIVHVFAEVDVIRGRLSRPRPGHLLTNAWSMYRSLAAEWDGVPEADFRIDTGTTSANGAAEIAIHFLATAQAPPGEERRRWSSGCP